MSQWDVIGLGENSLDYVYRLPEYPTPSGAGAKIQISSQTLSPGGQVATTLCACAAMGLRAKYIGTFGNDVNGIRMREELTTRGVDVGDALTRNVPNRYAVILVDERHGERIVLWQRDPALTLRPHELPRHLLATRVLHVDDVDQDVAIEAARLARDAGVVVTCDIERTTDRTEELVSSVSIPIFAEPVPEALTGESDPERALRKLRQRHPGWLCVTRGTQGALLLAGDTLHESAAFPVNAVDTTGAGDIFRAGFIVSMLRGDSAADVLQFACAAAAVACTRAGAIASVPTLEDVAGMFTTKNTKF